MQSRPWWEAAPRVFSAFRFRVVLWKFSPMIFTHFLLDFVDFSSFSHIIPPLDTIRRILCVTCDIWLKAHYREEERECENDTIGREQKCMSNRYFSLSRNFTKVFLKLFCIKNIKSPTSCVLFQQTLCWWSWNCGEEKSVDFRQFSRWK